MLWFEFVSYQSSGFVKMIPNAEVLGDGNFRKYLYHEGSILLNGLIVIMTGVGYL
jgi:hypothetical protein